MVLPGLAAGAMAFFLLAAATKRRPGAISRQSLNRMRKRLIGRGKSQIEKRLGKPRTIVPGPGMIWYYAVDARQQLAMAIRFRKERVCGVEFFHPPVSQDRNAVQSAC